MNRPLIVVLLSLFWLTSCSTQPMLDLSERRGGLTIVKAGVDGVIMESGLDALYGPIIVTMAMPEYPGSLQASSGKTLVKVIMEVDAHGWVRDVIITDSPDERFNRNAIACGKKFKFDPGRDASNNPIKTWVNFSFTSFRARAIVLKTNC